VDQLWIDLERLFRHEMFLDDLLEAHVRVSKEEGEERACDGGRGGQSKPLESRTRCVDLSSTLLMLNGTVRVVFESNWKQKKKRAG
jgi:hypothetical protein